MESTANICRLCNGHLQIAADSMPGYIEGKTFRILHCLECGTAVADPCRSDNAVYQAIYSQAENIPGYARYYRYAKEISNRRLPWRYLRNREECYWGIGAALDELFPNKNIAILEAGCGLGYLTYALTRQGYKRVLGIDVAAPAITAARHRFDCEYVVADISTYANETSERFDVMVMTEVIEHLEDPAAFIASARRLLKPEGCLICTTPNRDFGGHPQQIWATDLPPVHLWWFTEKGLVALSRQTGFSVSFVDFSKWNRQHFPSYEKALMRSRKGGVSAPNLAADGVVVRAAGPARKSRPYFLEGIQIFWRGLIHGRRNYSAKHDPISRSGFVCAVFKNSE